MSEETGVITNWGSAAERSRFNINTNQSSGTMSDNGKEIFQSRLWHGVPQLTEEQMSMFNAAYSGHTFLFVVVVPKFLTTGIYEDLNAHMAIKNLKAIIERASTGFSGPSNITAQFSDQNDGAERKVSHITQVTKAQSDISLKLHEFAGLPVKNAIELWLTGIFDPYSQHGSYHGNLGISGGWGIQNHSMSLLTVQVDPSWTGIQDAAYYFNMIPTEVPFDGFNWTKGESDIIQDYDIQFKCNEFRGPSIMSAAEQYMNNRILSLTETSVYNSRQFVPNTFSEGEGAKTTYYAVTGANNIISEAEKGQSMMDKVSVSGATYNDAPVSDALTSSGTVTKPVVGSEPANG